MHNSNCFQPSRRGPGLFRLLQSLFVQWQSVATIPGDREVDYYRERFNGQLKAVVETPDDPSFEPVLRGIWDELKSATTFDLTQEIEAVDKRALGRVRECVRAWGGRSARERLRQMRSLPIRFEPLDEERPTEVSFNRKERCFHIRAGEPANALWDYLTLEFSLFHEHLSHHFPRWSRDQNVLSEGYLFALEFDWFQYEAEPLENEVLTHVWNPRLAESRPLVQQGQWFLKRCGTPKCFAGFLLEWVASWDQIDDEVSEDLKAQLAGVFTRSQPRPQGRPTKDRKLRNLIEELVCPQCESQRWDFENIRNRLATALNQYVPRH